MPMRWILLLWMLLATPAAYAADAPPDPMELLRAATGRIKNAERFTGDFAFEVAVGLPGLEHGRAVNYKIAAERPNRFVFLRVDGDMGATVVSDGEQLVQYVAELQQYTEEPAPATLDAFSSSVSGMMLIEGGMGGFMMALLAEDPIERLTADVTASEYAGKEAVDGVQCHHLRLVQEEWDIDVWITAGETPTLRRIRPDLSKQFGEEERAAGFTMAISLDYTNWNFNPEIEEGTFAFKPPSRARLVEDFEAIAPAEVMPPIVSVPSLIGEPAPAFALVKLEGEEAFELKSAIGKQVIVLDFWSTWCPPCVEGLPKLAEVADQFKDKPVAVYAVNVEEEPDTVREFLEAHELHLQVLLDSNSSVAKKYQVAGIPQTVVIGLDGRVHVLHVGLPEDLKGELTESITALLNREDLAGEQLAERDQAGAAEAEPSHADGEATEADEAAEPEEASPGPGESP